MGSSPWRVISSAEFHLVGGPTFGGGQLTGYAFDWSADPEQAPVYKYSKAGQRRIIVAGREWMRKHHPKQWAMFCSARLLGTNEVVITPEFAQVSLILQADEEV